MLNQDQLRYQQESFIERIFVHKGNPLKLEIENFLVKSGKKELQGNIERELRSLKVSLQILDILRSKGQINY